MTLSQNEYSKAIAISNMTTFQYSLSKINRLIDELATAKKQLLEYEQAEAAVCPEDVGVKEYVGLLKAENQSFGNVLAVIHRDGGHYITEHGHKKASEDARKIVLDERAENNQLKDFARPVIRQECWSLFPQDGGDLQRLAEELGLIVSDVATQEDVDNALYEGYYEVGDDMRKFAKILEE